MCTENNSRPGIRNSSNSLVDNSALFYDCTEPTNRNATYIQCFSSESDSSNSGRSSSPTPTPTVDGMQVIRRSLQESEISPDIVDIIMHSWRDSTQKQYKVYINKWLHFCSERKNDPLHPTVTAVLAFLHSLFESGLSYSALNIARSAVSNIDMSDLKFIWRDQLYAFTSLPMGLTSSPRIFTKVLKPVFSYLRSQFGHTCLGYIDDSFYLEDSYTECEEATLRAIQLFVGLGFKIHPDTRFSAQSFREWLELFCVEYSSVCSL